MKTKELLEKIVKAGVITEQEINLLKRRMNAGEKIELPQSIYDGEINVTPEQSAKGWAWLKNQYQTPAGKERKNNPFGYREIDVLEAPDHYFYFVGFYDAGKYGNVYSLPIYLVCGAGTSFEYYVSGGEINIIG